MSLDGEINSHLDNLDVCLQDIYFSDELVMPNNFVWLKDTVYYISKILPYFTGKKEFDYNVFNCKDSDLNFEFTQEMSNAMLHIYSTKSWNSSNRTLTDKIVCFLTHISELLAFMGVVINFLKNKGFTV